MASGSEASDSQASIARLISFARSGSDEALGKLLEECRAYLLLVANRELPPELRGKAGASDLVQETFLQAQGHFDQFRDDGESELLAWLRQILLNNVGKLKRRYHGTVKRQLTREAPAREDSRGEPIYEMAALEPSPSSLLVAQERDAALSRALEQLPEDYRQVVTWRNFDYLPFEEIGFRLGRTSDAARKLWVRAVERLQELLDVSDDK